MSKEGSHGTPACLQETAEQCLDRVYCNLVLLQEVTDICVGDDAVTRMYEHSKRAIVALMDYKKALAEARATRSESAPTRREVLAEVHQRLHDMKNLQRASAWPHVEGVARAEKMVWELLQDSK